jgi:hypothetical protein
MRARLPDADGFVERDGVRVFYEVFGDGDPTILLMPAWSITHSRIWKMQVPFLARHYRAITYRPIDAEAVSRVAARIAEMV